MVEQDSVALRRIWRKWYRPTLDHLFKEFEAAGIYLTPTDALEEMENCFKWELNRGQAEGGSELKSSELSRTTFRFDHVAMTCEAHHYAVDLFYRYYFPRAPSSKGKARRGAPSLSEEYLDRILQLRGRGENYVSIAHALGQPKDRMRHQVKIAETRYREVVERVRKLGAAQWPGNISSKPVPKPRIHARRRKPGSKSRAKPKK